MAGAVLLACWLSPAGAWQALDDAVLGEVTGADGIALAFGNTQTLLSAVEWDVDTGVTAVGGVAMTPEVYARFDGLSLRPVDAAGTLLGGAATGGASLDVGATSTTAAAALALRAYWSRMRLLVTDFRHELAPLVSGVSPSTGTLAFDAAGSFVLRTTNGLFNNTAGSTEFALDIQDASLFFRQGAVGTPELMLDNLRFNPSFQNGSIGIDSSGLRVSAPSLAFNLTFDVRYEGAPPAPGFTYTAAGDRPMLYYGWQGTLTNFEARVRPGGVWYGTTGTPAVYNTANRSEGVNFTARWDYDPTFAWVVGESRTTGTGLPRLQLQFDQWQKIGTGFAFDVQNNTLDVIRAGQGPGGLCWGTTVSVAGPAATCTSAAYTDATFFPRPQFLDVTPENGIALLARDAKQMAYSTRVIILDDFNNDGDYADTASSVANVTNGTLETQNVQWGLIYTLGDFDANVYLYPGGYNFGTNAATTTGLKMDFLVMTQSHDGADAGLAPDWATGSHYMVADTAPGINFGIGYMNAAVLLAADDLYVSLLPGGLNFRTHPATGKTRIQFKGRFGGGDVPNMVTPVNGFDINANFESTAFNFTLEPPASGQNYLGFSGIIDLSDTDIANFSESTAVDGSDDGSYLSISEPGRPSVDVRAADITGRLQWTGGRLDLVSDSEVANQTAKLEVVSGINFGATGGGGAFSVGRVEFGNQALGTMVIPTGTWYAAVGLKRQ